MTLVEILLAIAIFLVISVAMLGVMAAASSLYNQGERSRAANDEMMAVINLLERDLARAVPREQGGQFVARVVEPCGNCIAAWVIEDHDPAHPDDSGYSLVAWGAVGAAPDARLRRVCYKGVVPGDLGTYPQDLDGGNGILELPASANGIVSRDLAAGVLHFGVWLLGTSRGGGAAPGTGGPWLYPEDRYWIRVREDRLGGFLEWTEPYRPDPVLPVGDLGLYSTFKDDHRYPLLVRFTLMLAGGGRRVQDGRVLADDGDTGLRVGGLDTVAVLPGTLGRIGDELVGIHGRADGRLLVNTDLDDGPLADSAPGMPANGRGVYRSAKGTHPRGAVVYLGHQVSLIRELPGDPRE